MLRSVYLALTLCASPAYADYDAAVRAFDRGDLELAKELARPAAEAGDVRAQYLLGSVGLETAAENAEAADAVAWLVIAAEQGHIEAAFEAAVALFEGDGVAEDHAAAAALFRRAAEADHGPAAYRLAVQHEDGDGVARDLNEAERWYGAAAASGLPDAFGALHDLYVRRGDRIAAVGSLLAAAAHGVHDAAARLQALQPAPTELERRQAAAWAADRWPAPSMPPVKQRPRN